MISSIGEKFPYQNFTFRLEVKEGKDNKVCWFECQEHVNRFLDRHKLKKKDYTLTIKSND
jgi:hypothetical protein